MNDYDELLQSLKGVAHSLQSLSQRAVGQYAPLVDQIVMTQSRDIRHIEHTLDGLLDFCGHEPALRLYKKLCRYYWELDPVSTAGYINAYRDLFDSDTEPAFDPDEVSGKALAAGSDATPSAILDAPASPAASAVPLTEALP